MNRFTPKNSRRSRTGGILIPVCVFLLALGALLYGLSSISQTTSREQKKSLEAALNRSIMDCYATQGSYPESLAYIEEHYPLLYDRERFYISYQPIGSNIMPEVTIIDRKASDG